MTVYLSISNDQLYKVTSQFLHTQTGALNQPYKQLNYLAFSEDLCQLSSLPFLSLVCPIALTGWHV